MGKNKRKRSHTKHVFVQKKYRDALFRRIFNEKPVLLELYNALNQTDYDDADELIFYTIDDVIYLGYNCSHRKRCSCKIKMMCHLSSEAR